MRYMTWSEVKIRQVDFMDNKSEIDSLRSRIREVEDENQELRTQNLLQNRTIVELRSEIALMRIQLTEMADTSALLTERVRNLTQNVSQNPLRADADGNVGLITAPPLMAPPPVPPPLPPARIRISPRQVGAGEALTTPLGVSVSSPPRYRIKRDTRQGFYRSTRSPYRRLDVPEPGPSSPAQYLSAERPNYFVGLRIIPQFQTSFVCSQNQSSGYSDSASDSSGSDENPQLFKKLKMRVFDGEPSLKKPATFARDFELLKNMRNFHHQKVRQTILQNYNLALPNTNSKFFFPLPWERKNRDNPTLPSTSGDEDGFFHPSNRPGNPLTPQGASQNCLKNVPGLSDRVQYTFPTIHEGLHHSGGSPVMGHSGETARLRKLKKNIPYSPGEYSTSPDPSIFKSSSKGEREATEEQVHVFTGFKNPREIGQNRRGIDSESISSADEAAKSRTSRTVSPPQEMPSDFDQDGFQADESSNCLTSTENSLERINISESNFEKKQ